MHFLFFFEFSAINIKYEHSSPGPALQLQASPRVFHPEDFMCCWVPMSRVGHLETSHKASESINAGSKVTFPAQAHTAALAAHLQRLPQASLILPKMIFLAHFLGPCPVLAACRAAPITAACICLHCSSRRADRKQHSKERAGSSLLLSFPPAL